MPKKHYFIPLLAILILCGCQQKSSSGQYLLNGEVPETYYQSMASPPQKSRPLLAESGKNPYLAMVLNKDHTYQFNDGAANIKGTWTVKETAIILDKLGEGKGIDVEMRLREKHKCLKVSFTSPPYEGLEEVFCPEVTAQ